MRRPLLVAFALVIIGAGAARAERPASPVVVDPWFDGTAIVFGLQKTADAVSPTVTAAMVLFSLIAFTLVYALLMVADVVLLRKYAEAGVSAEGADAPAGARG